MNRSRQNRDSTHTRVRSSILASILLLLCLSAPALSQDSSNPGYSELNTSEVLAPGSVVLDGKPIFVIKAALGRYSPEQRAVNIVSRIERLLRDPEFDPASVEAIETESGIDIVADDLVITSITNADSKVTGKEKSELAAEYVSQLQESLASAKSNRSLSDTLEDLSFKNFIKSVVNLVLEPTILKSLIVLVAVLTAAAVVGLIQKALYRRMTDSSKFYAAKKIVTFVSYIVLVIFATIVFRDALGNLAVVLGAATAAVAFSLKEVIVSLAGWIAITFGDFYKIGDRVQIAGVKGDIVDIGFAKTTLMELGEWITGDLYTGRLVRVANSLIFSEPLFNYSSGFPFVWDEIVIPVKYGSDEKIVRQILMTETQVLTADSVDKASKTWHEFGKKFLVEPAQTEPMVTLILNDNWMEYTVRYVVDFKRRRHTKDRLCTAFLNGFLEHKDSVAFASATFHLVEAPVIDVRLTGSSAFQSVLTGESLKS